MNASRFPFPSLAAFAVVVAVACTAPSTMSQDRAAVTVSVDTGGPSTRLVLTQSRTVPYAVTQRDDRIEVAYAAPVDVAPAERRVNDAILAGWRTAGDRTLVLEVGPGFRRFESFELRNPVRLILDLQGERADGTERRPVSKPEDRATTVIVIDPGHGGAETGAVGPAGLEEKAVALDLARRLKGALQQDSSVSVVLTRDDDRHVPLDERTAVANHNRADLFVSIHLNASRRRDAYGAETYFLSADATDDEARILAGLENRADGRPDGETPSLPPDAKRRGLDLVLWDLAQNQYLAESSALAEAVQRELNVLTGTRDRGVRQAPFRVLMGATMPAILVEVGFISNPDEERQLMQPAYRARVVEALARAVREFREGLETYQAPGDSGVGRP